MPLVQTQLGGFRRYRRDLAVFVLAVALLRLCAENDDLPPVSTKAAHSAALRGSMPARLDDHELGFALDSRSMSDDLDLDLDLVRECLRTRGMRPSQSADAARARDLAEIFAMTMEERMKLALRLGRRDRLVRSAAK
jgi:hypothetical protein